MSEDPNSLDEESPNPQRGLGVSMTIGMWVVVLAFMTLFFQSWQEK